MTGSVPTCRRPTVTPAQWSASNDFAGQPSQGTWRFCVSDNYKNDVGTLQNVTLNLTCSPSATPRPERNTDLHAHLDAD